MAEPWQKQHKTGQRQRRNLSVSVALHALLCQDVQPCGRDVWKQTTAACTRIQGFYNGAASPGHVCCKLYHLLAACVPMRFPCTVSSRAPLVADCASCIMHFNVSKLTSLLFVLGFAHHLGN
jgi:hypothetical protein